jgi:hypothetical protein
MKYARFILPAYLLLPVFLFSQSGATCGTAILLTLDGVIRNYSTSSSTGGYVLCLGAGTSPITWFQFTTNASAECPLLNVTASDGFDCEVALYSACNGSGNLITASSMCFYDGGGLWAPAQSVPVSANTTYYLRIKTSTACNISIGGQPYAPDNNSCSGAFSISTVGISDNNSCHQPGTGITASQLCAFSLENTAWYQFYIAADGQAIINISSISCDNGANNNNNGFQIGFFTGNCSSLNWINCTSGAGSFVQATTPSLTSGTKVFVAIDGNAGSNCSYSIGGINVFGVLDVNLRNFSGWKTASSNILKWTAANETGGYYEIERSFNGKDFSSLGRINSKGNVIKTDYSFEDKDPASVSFYRLKQVDNTNKISLSQVIKIERTDFHDIELTLENPVFNFLKININTRATAKYEYRIINLQGEILQVGSLECYKGTNRFSKQVTALQTGSYFLILRNKEISVSKSFVKMN